MSDNNLDSRPLFPRPRQRWVAFVGFGLAAVLVAILLRTPAASGYEPSIYSPYPQYFWVLLVGAFVLGQLLILNGALSTDITRTNWRSGFLLTGVLSAILVCMPYIRGYPVYGRGDVLTHIGYTQTIQRTGGDPFQILYQSLHQTVLALTYATGLEPIQLINGLAVVFSLFSLAASYALVATVFDRRQALMTLPFALALIGGRAYLNPSPFAQSVLLLPFVLYVFIKAQRVEWFAFRSILAISIIGLILFHPLTAVFLIIVLGIHRGVVILSGFRTGKHSSLELTGVTAANVMHLSVVVFLAWYYNFIGIIRRFESVFQRLLDPGSGQTKLDSYSSTVTEYSPALIDLAQVGLVKFGQSAALLGIGALFVLLSVWLFLWSRPLSTPYLLTFGGGLVVFTALGALFMFVDLIGGFGRPLIFAELFSALVAGSILYRTYQFFNWQSVVTAVATVALLVLVTLAVFGLYYSPAGGESNHQVTDQELTGAQWYLDTDLNEWPLEEQGIHMYRFEHALNGSESESVPQEGTLPPPRFNYTVHSTLGASYNETQYFVLTERARVFYPTVYPDYEASWRYRPEDYDRLARDPTVSHIYDVGEFDIYRIEPAQGS